MIEKNIISELRSTPIELGTFPKGLKGKEWHSVLRRNLRKIKNVETKQSQERFIPCDKIGLLGSDYYYTLANRKLIEKPELLKKVKTLIDKKIWLRESIAKDLRIVDISIEKSGYRIYLLSGYRSPEFQKLLRQFATLEQGKEFMEKMLSNPEIYLPHASGGAFDIELMEIATGKLLPTKLKGHFDRIYLESLSNPKDSEREIRDNRRLIHNLLTTNVILSSDRVFIPQPFEYWHYGRNEKLSSALASIQGISHPSYYTETGPEDVFRK